MIYYRSVVFCFVLSAFAALAGCSSKTAQPDVPTTASASPPAETTKQPAAPSSSTSSLDALKRGDSTATPASSPLQEVYFDFDSYDLRPDARDVLKTDGQWLKANPAAQIQIEGHCDERGTGEYNLALGSKRAQSVKDYLVTLGTDAGRLSTISYGSELPVCKEHSGDCWQKNRRVKFVIQPAKPAA